MSRSPEQQFMHLPAKSPKTYVKIGRHANISNSVDLFLQKIAKYEVLTRDQEVKLFRELIAARESGDERLYRRKREEVVCHNGRLAMAVAKKYFSVATRYGIGMDDLLATALEGLIKAIDKFDPERGNKFSTMAIWWIRQQVTRSVHDGDTIRKPVHYCEKFSKITSHVKKLHGKLNRFPTVEEICESLHQDAVAIKKFVNRDCPKITPEVVREVMDNFKRTASLNYVAQCDDGEIGEWLDRISDPESLSPTEYVEKKELECAIAAALADHRLTDQQSEFLRLYYGIGTGSPMKFSEVAEAMGLTKQEARHLRFLAERKIQRPSFYRSYKLKDFWEAS